MFAKNLLLVVSILARVTRCHGVTARVIPPIRSSGQEVGLIFVPGASIPGEAYDDTAAAIQKASELRVWVALTDNYLAGTPNPLELPAAITKAIDQLQAEGMKGRNYVGIAHSLGGVFLSPYARDSPLSAIVLLGSYLTRGNNLRDYPHPILTLSGELDGQARITRIAVAFRELLSDLATSSSAIYRTPVIVMKGTSHAQFASGAMPPAVTKYDLKPEVTLAKAHQLIAGHVSNFMSVTFCNSSDDDLVRAMAGLETAFNESADIFMPLIRVQKMDSEDKSSPWSVYLQNTVGGTLQDHMEVTNRIESASAFLLSKPSMLRSGSTAKISMISHLSFPTNPIDISTVPESPNEMDVKLKSQDAIRKMFPEWVTHMRSKDMSTCREFNEMAISLALNSSTPDAKRRYQSYGRPITCKDDVVYGSDIRWVTAGFTLDEDDSGLHVQSVALKTDPTEPLFPGMFYCKLLSPYRAMEWINVDSLRPHKP